MDDALYKYGVINKKQVSVSVENWMDIWSWREYKTKPSDWFKLKPTIHTNQDGYKNYVIKFNNKNYGLSRVIYKLYNEDWDITDTSNENVIDHINVNSLDNRIENLRVLTQQQNQWNRTDVRGYNFDKRSGKYTAQLGFNGKQLYGKARATAEEARADYLLLKEKYHIIPTSQEETNHRQITT